MAQSFKAYFIMQPCLSLNKHFFEKCLALLYKFQEPIDSIYVK